MEDGWKKIYSEGFVPFTGMIESKKQKGFPAKEFVGLYDIIFAMCIQRDPYNHSEALYEKYSSSIKEYLEGHAANELRNARAQNATVFLNEWQERWTKTTLMVKGLSRLFMYLDRYYTSASMKPDADPFSTRTQVPSLSAKGYELYKTTIFDNFETFAKTAILNTIAEEREGQPQNRTLLQDSVNVFVELGKLFNDLKLELYRKAIEVSVVEQASAFYRTTCLRWLEQCSCPEFLDRAEKALQSERQRVEAYLHRSTLEPLMKECYKQLLKSNQAELIKKQTGVDHMLEHSLTDDLARLFRLFKEDPADLPPIADIMSEHIARKGTTIVNSLSEGAARRETKVGGPAPGPSAGAPSDAAAAAAGGDSKEDKDGGDAAESNHDMVTKLIDLHANYNRIIKTCFESNPVFQKALKKAFEDFINRDDRVSHLLSKFVNDVLKKGSTITHKESLQATLDNVVFIYGYIQEKDVFERSYQLALAHRLLNGLCEHEHNEKAMITKLKTECGYQWTNKLEGMFKDMTQSQALMEEFLTLPESKNPTIELTVSVCTSGYWPSQKQVPFTMPEELREVCERFRAFYLSKHSTHRLDWRVDQGRADVIVNFSPKSRYTLNVSTYMMLVLLVFNSQKIVTFKQIQEVTGVSRYELSSHLLSMVHPKTKIILKKPPGKVLDDDHQFMLNASYANVLKRVYVPLLVSQTEVRPEIEDEEQKAIQMQRRNQIDCAIVRIMKARKTLKHLDLVTEVIQQLQARFKPKSNDIKKRIESCIEQEYLKRDHDDRSVYHYVA